MSQGNLIKTSRKKQLKNVFFARHDGDVTSLIFTSSCHLPSFSLIGKGCHRRVIDDCTSGERRRCRDLYETKLFLSPPRDVLVYENDNDTVIVVRTGPDTADASQRSGRRRTPFTMDSDWRNVNTSHGAAANRPVKGRLVFFHPILPPSTFRPTLNSPLADVCPLLLLLLYTLSYTFFLTLLLDGEQGLFV